MSDSSNRFLLLFGTVTGQSKAIAEEIAERAPRFGLTPELQDLSEKGKEVNLEKEKCVVIVISTTGDGDAPDGASKFVRKLKRRTLAPDFLSGLNYTVLALGDSNYSNFCRCGRDVDNRLEALGAKRFYRTGLADDGIGLEVETEPWMDGLFPALQKFLGVASEKDVLLTETITLLSLLDKNKESENSDMKNIDGMTRPSTSVSDTHTTMTSPPGDEGKSTEQRSPVDGSVSNTKNTIGIEVKVKQVADYTPGKSYNDSAYSSDIESPVIATSSNSTQDQPSEMKILSSPSIQDDAGKCTDYSEAYGHVASSESAVVVHGSLSQWSESPCVPVHVADTPASPAPLIHSQSPLSEQTLTIPLLPPPFLHATFSDESIELTGLPYQNGCKLPSAASDIMQAEVTSACVLTATAAVKKTLLLRLSFQEEDVKYSPGDSISILCPNNTSEVNLLLDRLGLTDKADFSVTLSVLSDTKKRRAAVPAHVHPTSTLRHILTTCLNIREPPSKAFIRSLLEYTSDPLEMRRMQELCSKEGAQAYTDLVRGHHVTLLDFLYAFPSCRPPVERILEHLPRLQPRPYSACSCQDTCPDSLDIVFNVVEIPGNLSEGHYYSRRGVCTGWLDDITSNLQAGKKEEKIKIPIFLRTNQHFRPPDDLSKPLIMIGPGTGVAPFIGFLHKRALQRKSLNEDQSYGATWLFYGCRNKNKDFLFREELEQFETDGVLSELLVAFSRDQPQESSTAESSGQSCPPPRYVQDLMRSSAPELCQLLTEGEALVYVCGDAKNMAKDVNAAFEEVLQTEKGMSADDAHMFMMKKRIHKTFLEDVWV